MAAPATRTLTGLDGVEWDEGSAAQSLDFQILDTQQQSLCYYYRQTRWHAQLSSRTSMHSFAVFSSSTTMDSKFLLPIAIVTARLYLYKPELYSQAPARRFATAPNHTSSV